MVGLKNQQVFDDRSDAEILADAVIVMAGQQCLYAAPTAQAQRVQA